MEENENKRSERVENGDGVEKWVDKKYLIFFFPCVWLREWTMDRLKNLLFKKKKMKTMPKKKKMIKAKHKGNDKFNASQKKKKKKKKKRKKKKQH